MPDISKQEYQAVIAGAAAKHGVPVEILWGVYGVETDFGKNSNTSSAGAMGPFQFIPSTAKAYHYPLTNNPTPPQFALQADAAAHYLADLHKSHGGSWDAALRAYSGGGYGLAEVQAKAKTGKGPGDAGQGTGVLGTGVGPDIAPGASEAVGGAISGTAGAILKLANAVEKFVEGIFSASVWFRVGKVVVGLFLGALGLTILARKTGVADIPKAAALAA